MSRSGYSEYDSDCDAWRHVMWRGAVDSSIGGRRGQAFLREMLVALDALPEKRLIDGDLARAERVSCSHWGLHETESVCAMGAVARARGTDVSDVDPEDSGTVAGRMGIARAMACEIAFVNDEDDWWDETPEARYTRVRRWVVSNIRQEVRE